MMNDEMTKSWEALDAKLAEMEDLLKEAGSASTERGPDDEWSPFEIGLHLFIAESLGLKYLKYKKRQEGEVPKMGVIQKVKYWLLMRAMKSKKKYQAFDAIDPRHPDYASRFEGVDNFIEAFFKMRTDFREFLNQQTESYLSGHIFKHPIAGRLTGIEMIRFFNAHFERHLNQIKSIILNG